MSQIVFVMQKILSLYKLLDEVLFLMNIEITSKPEAMAHSMQIEIRTHCNRSVANLNLLRLLKDYRSKVEKSDEAVDRNETKEVLAAFWLIKKGVIKVDELDIVPSKRGSKGNEKLNHRYFTWFLNIQSSKNIPSQDISIKQLLGDFHPLHQEFENTYWYLYMYANNERVINRHIIHIKGAVASGLAACDLINANEEFKNFSGYVYTDATWGYLVFHLIADNTRYCLLRTKIPNARKPPQLMLGQANLTYSSIDCILSDRFVMEQFKPENQDIEKYTKRFFQKSNSSFPKGIDKGVAAYLLKYGAGLYSPVEQINDTASLNKWLLAQESPIDKILLTYCRKYRIYYCYLNDKDQKVIHALDLEFMYDALRSGVSGKLKVDGKINFSDKMVYRKNHFIIAVFSRPDVENWGIYLQMHIGGAFVSSEMEVFIATISGLSDTEETAVAYEAVIIPQKESENTNHEMPEQVNNYFLSKVQFQGLETHQPRGFKLDNLGKTRAGKGS